MKTVDRNNSLADFKAMTRNTAIDSLRQANEKIVETANCPDSARVELKGYEDLYSRFLGQRDYKIDWEKIHPPPADMVLLHKQLEQMPKEKAADLLDKLVVVKLNGGLGTTMGCTGPKSAIEVRDDMTFLDLTVRQIEWLNETYNCEVPLILMNSFNTHDETDRIIRKYAASRVHILTFNQSRYPRIDKETLLPLAKQYEEDNAQWYPPGHGDVYTALKNSGYLDQLIAKGKEYMFMSNIDNLGATVDLEILNYMDTSGSEYIMEVTNKTMADVKGGTLIDYEGNTRLLELAQVPKDHVEDFKSIKKFKIFNTNNLWMKLEAISRVVNDGLSLEIIVNEKIVNGNQKIIQLETAVGAGIKHFHNAKGMNVPRSRFLPVKTCSDLFLVKSNLYTLSHGSLVVNPERPIDTVPLVKLGQEYFRKVQSFLSRFAKIPNIVELDHLTVTGDVTFGAGVILRGTVIIVANHKEHIDIPAGAILENKVVTGNLRILDH